MLVVTAPQISPSGQPQGISNNGNAASNPPDGINYSNLHGKMASGNLIPTIPNSWGFNPAGMPFSQGDFLNIPRSQENLPAAYLPNYAPIPAFIRNPSASGNPITGNSK